MSIASEIARITQNVSDAFSAVEQMGGTVAQANSDHLAEAIYTIPTVTTPESGAALCTVDISGVTDELYPCATLLAGDCAYGAGSYGETSAGGSDLTLIYAAYVYGDRTITVYAPKEYAAYTNVTEIGGGVFSLDTGAEDDTTGLTLIIH